MHTLKASDEGRQGGRWLLAAALSWLAGGALYLTLPPSGDQFNHAYMGWRLLEGDVPYVGFIDQNWPGVMAFHALATAFFGNHLATWRAFDLMVFAGTAWAMADVLRLGFGRGVARALWCVAPWFYATVGYWVAGQHDMSAAQMAMIALWCHVRGGAAGTPRASGVWQVGVGVFAGLAMLQKPTLGVLLVLMPLQVWLLGGGFRQAAANGVLATMATVATLAAAVAAVLSLGTTLQALVDATLVYNTYHFDAASPGWQELLVRSGPWPAFLVLSALPAVPLLAAARREPLAATALPVLATAGAVSYGVQARGLPYHLAPLLLACMGLWAVQLRWAAGTVAQARLVPGWQRAGALTLVGMVGAGLAYRLWGAYRVLPMAVAAGDYRLHLGNFQESHGLSFADIASFVQRVERTDDSGCVLLAGSSTAIHYLSRRPQPTRFYYFPALATAHAPMPMAEAWLSQWEQDLARARCRYVLVPPALWQGNGKEEQARIARALTALLKHYETAGIVGRELTLYVRR